MYSAFWVDYLTTGMQVVSFEREVESCPLLFSKHIQ